LLIQDQRCLDLGLRSVFPPTGTVWRIPANGQQVTKTRSSRSIDGRSRVGASQSISRRCALPDCIASPCARGAGRCQWRASQTLYGSP
jgi:hypothetical protein